MTTAIALAGVSALLCVRLLRWRDSSGVLA